MNYSKSGDYKKGEFGRRIKHSRSQTSPRDLFQWAGGLIQSQGRPRSPKIDGNGAHESAESDEGGLAKTEERVREGSDFVPLFTGMPAVGAGCVPEAGSEPGPRVPAPNNCRSGPTRRGTHSFDGLRQRTRWFRGTHSQWDIDASIRVGTWQCSSWFRAARSTWYESADPRSNRPRTRLPYVERQKETRRDKERATGQANR